MLEGNSFHIRRPGNHVKVRFSFPLLDYNLLALFKQLTGWHFPMAFLQPKLNDALFTHATLCLLIQRGSQRGDSLGALWHLSPAPSSMTYITSRDKELSALSSFIASQQATPKTTKMHQFRSQERKTKSLERVIFGCNSIQSPK